MTSSRLEERCKAPDVPAVEISSVRQDLGLPYVGEDNEAIGRLASEHLLECNFKSFAWGPILGRSSERRALSRFFTILTGRGI